MDIKLKNLIKGRTVFDDRVFIELMRVKLWLEWTKEILAEFRSDENQRNGVSGDCVEKIAFYILLSWEVLNRMG